MGTGLIHRSNYTCACLCWIRLSSGSVFLGKKMMIWCFSLSAKYLQALWYLYGRICSCCSCSLAQISAAASNSDHISVEQLCGSTLEGRLPPLTEQLAHLCLLWEGMTPGRSRVPAGHRPITPSLTHSDTHIHTLCRQAFYLLQESCRHFQPINSRCTRKV